MKASTLLTAPRGRPRRFTQGNTLIVVVLLTMLIMTMVLTATMRLSLTSRQNSSDQRATLQSQYSAESSLALMRSQIADMQTILSGSSVSIPSGTKPAILDQLALALCGNGVTWNKNADTIAEFKKVRTANGSSDDSILYTNPTPLQCNVTPYSNPAQYKMLAFIINPTTFGKVLPSAELPTGSDLSTLQSWWMNHIYPVQNIGNAQYRLTPTRIVKLNNVTYRIYFTTSNILATDSSQKSNRIIAGMPTENGNWWLQIELPSLAPYALFTNHQRSAANSRIGATPDVYFSGQQTFDGPVHTNESFLFDNTAKTNFLGKVSSVGCTDLPATGANAQGGCTAKPSVYLDDGNKSNYPGTNAYIKGQIAYRTSGVNFNGIDPTFNDAYKALPVNANDQKALAEGQDDPNIKGLTVPTADTGVYMFAGDSNGNTLNTYNPTTKSWSEPSPTYQYVYMQNAQGIDTDNMYRIDSEGNVYKGSGVKNTTWSKITGTFNGVIYSDSTSAINVSGPTRLNSNTTGALNYAPPALASFSNMSVTAANGLKIKTDLTLSSSPCTNTQYNSNNCSNDKSESTGTLGLFAPKGNITIASDAPNNINIHAALMAGTGQVTVEGYDTAANKGTANITGSVIENWYGPFGLTNGRGYSRNFSADPRFLQGLMPRGFPTASNWVGKDASISKFELNDVIWKQGTQ